MNGYDTLIENIVEFGRTYIEIGTKKIDIWKGPN